MVIIQGVGIWGIVFIGEGSRFLRDIPQQTRFRSVPDVMDTKFAAPLLAELLIKCQRLPRGFLWNTSFPVLVFIIS